MKLERITNKQGCFLTLLFFSSNCYSLLFAAKYGASVWFCYLIASLISIAVVFLINTLMKYAENRTFFEFLDFLLPCPFGRMITALLMLYAFLSTCTSLSIFGQFNQLTALSKTPTIIIPLAVILLGVWACRSGIQTIGRMASLTILFAVAVFLLFSLLALDGLNPDLLRIPKENESGSFLRGGLIVFCNQLGDIILLTVLYPHFARRSTRGRATMLGVVFAGGILFIISIITVMTLGGSGISGDAYPVFTVLSVRTIGGFIQHLELASSVAMTLFAFFRVSLSLYFITQAFRHLFSLDDGRAPILPIGLLLASMTQLLYHGMPMLMVRLESNLSLWILLSIQIICPFLLFVLALIKTKKIKTLGCK
ncbi:MAG: endospore germination permease [Oscillospiraceae bacterium]|nr:endospore germination permease [Oscillospiraceae bacterium]